MIDLKELYQRAIHGNGASSAEVIELVGLIEDSQKDAARYQWLAVQHWVEPEATFRLGLEGVEFINTYRFQLDSAIDAAMAATEGEA